MEISNDPKSYIELKTMSDREMTTAGLVWHFDTNQMATLKEDILITIFNKINRYSEQGFYTGWVAENSSTTFVLTSSEPLHSKEKLHREIMKYLKAVKGYSQESGGYPLQYQVVPVLRRGRNGFGLPAVDESFLTRADELFIKNKKEPTNIYRKLLNELPRASH